MYCHFSTSGIGYYQHLEDTLTLLYALEQRETESYGIYAFLKKKCKFTLCENNSEHLNNTLYFRPYYCWRFS